MYEYIHTYTNVFVLSNSYSQRITLCHYVISSQVLYNRYYYFRQEKMEFKRVQWLLKFTSVFLKKPTLKLRTTNYNAILFLFYHDASKISHELEIKSAPEIECFH